MRKPDSAPEYPFAQENEGVLKRGVISVADRLPVDYLDVCSALRIRATQVELIWRGRL